MLVTVLPDEKWLAKMPKDRPPDPEFYRRLCTAAEDPSLTNAHENAHKALYQLAQHGLIADCSSSSPLAPIAQYICSTLLNFSLQNNTHNDVSFQLSLDPVDSKRTFRIPARSRLILWHLAQAQDLSIFVFSSRDRPVVYNQRPSNHAVAFFHRVDSFRGTSEFVVLAPSTHLFPRAATRPQQQRLPPPPSQVPLASFRTHKRSRAAYEHDDHSMVTEDACMRAFKRACIEGIETRIWKEVAPKLKKGTGPDLSASRRKVQEHLLHVTRPPPGVVEGSLVAIRNQYNLGASFNYNTFSNKFASGSSKHVDRWKDVVRSEYDQAWTKNSRRS